MTKPRVFMLSDSLGLPRVKPEFVALESTWPQLLREHLRGAWIHQLSFGGATTDDLLPQFDFLDGQNPALVIVQAGIVDCAPRAFRKTELAVLLASRAGRALVNRMERSTLRMLRKVRQVSYVPKARFAKNVDQIATRFRCPVLWVGIVGGQDYDRLVPGITARIREYNEVLKARFGACFVDLQRLVTPAEMMADGHHLNERGHRSLAQILAEHQSVRALRANGLDLGEANR